MIGDGARDAVGAACEVLSDQSKVIVGVDVGARAVFAVGEFVRVIDEFRHRLGDFVRQREQQRQRHSKDDERGSNEESRRLTRRRHDISYSQAIGTLTCRVRKIQDRK